MSDESCPKCGREFDSINMIERIKHYNKCKGELPDALFKESDENLNKEKINLNKVKYKEVKP